MKKVIGGKTYVTVPAQVDGSCQGCAAQHDSGLCDKLHTDENGMFTPNICAVVNKIFKEQTMSEQKEKTALELVDEIIARPGCPSIKHLTCLKSAIERERDANEITIDGLEELVKSNTRTIQDMNDRLKLCGYWNPQSPCARLRSCLTGCRMGGITSWSTIME